MNLHHIPEDRYAEFLEHVPQVCVAIVLQHDGDVLVPRRTNEPATGE